MLSSYFSPRPHAVMGTHRIRLIGESSPMPKPLNCWMSKSSGGKSGGRAFQVGRPDRAGIGQSKCRHVPATARFPFGWSIGFGHPGREEVRRVLERPCMPGSSDKSQQPALAWGQPFRTEVRTSGRSDEVTSSILS